MQVISEVRLRVLDKLEPSVLPTEVPLFQFGDNTTSKGTFKLDAEGARSVMDAYAKHGVELHFDYDHDMRDAAAWFTPELRSDGIWATNIRWTSVAAGKLQNREYRFFSPTFYIDGDKRITKLINVALTNLPASEKQRPLVAASNRISLAQWSTAFMDDLPDSSFLYVEDGGKKDSDGKTVPRSLRHFPVRDASGKIDPDHLRNALSRIPQSSLPAEVKARLSAEAERLLNSERKSTSEANDRLTRRIASSFRSVMGMPIRRSTW